MSAPSGKLVGKIRPVEKLTLSETHRLFQLMSEYYEGIEWETFSRDLLEKSAVILLNDAGSGKICGFSTLISKPLQIKNKKVRAVFSGDTVIEKSYWGQSALSLMFARYLYTQKIKHPTTPLYWFLISKGYKTYLLMTRNFEEHYPRFDRETPIFYRELMDRFYGTRFGSAYNAQTGLIQFDHTHCRVREGVAEIDLILRRKNPEVDFFSQVNPTWKEGTELACVAEMQLRVPVNYVAKRLRKSFSTLRSAFSHPAPTKERIST